MHCTLLCFLLPGNRHQWPAWVCYKVCKATKAGKPWSWTPNCDAFLAVKEKLSQRQNQPPALLPDQNVNRTPQLMVSLSSDCGLNWVQLLGRRMTVTPYGGEQHVFHIPAGESSSLRLSHSLPPWCHNLFWCLWHLDYFWCEGAACISYISLGTKHNMFNVCHLIVSLSLSLLSSSLTNVWLCLSHFLLPSLFPVFLL